MAGHNIPALSVKRYISSALDVIIHLSRLVDGSRKVTSIQEVSGMEGETVTLQEIFYFEQTGIDGQGAVKGRFRARGVRPRFVEKFKTMGIQVPTTLFDSDKVYEV
jgi:pilus assembly protein CpaF